MSVKSVVIGTVVAIAAATAALADERTSVGGSEYQVVPRPQPPDHAFVTPTTPQGGAMGSFQHGNVGGTATTDGRGNYQGTIQLTIPTR
jgi:hypothetical protein